MRHKVVLYFLLKFKQLFRQQRLFKVVANLVVALMLPLCLDIKYADFSQDPHNICRFLSRIQPSLGLGKLSYRIRILGDKRQPNKDDNYRDIIEHVKVQAKSSGWQFVKPGFTCSFIKNVVHASCLSFMTVGPFRGVVVKITRLLHQNFVFYYILLGHKRSLGGIRLAHSLDRASRIVAFDPSRGSQPKARRPVAPKKPLFCPFSYKK